MAVVLRRQVAQRSGWEGGAGDLREGEGPKHRLWQDWQGAPDLEGRAPAECRV